MAEDQDDEGALYKVDTVPPPDGESDAYNAPTRIGPLAASVVAEMMSGAERAAFESNQAVAKAPKPKGEPEPASARAAASAEPLALETKGPTGGPMPSFVDDDDDREPSKPGRPTPPAPAAAPVAKSDKVAEVKKPTPAPEKSPLSEKIDVKKPSASIEPKKPPPSTGKVETPPKVEPKKASPSFDKIEPKKPAAGIEPKKPTPFVDKAADSKKPPASDSRLADARKPMPFIEKAADAKKPAATEEKPAADAKKPAAADEKPTEAAKPSVEEAEPAKVDKPATFVEEEDEDNAATMLSLSAKRPQAEAPTSSVLDDLDKLAPRPATPTPPEAATKAASISPALAPAEQRNPKWDWVVIAVIAAVAAVVTYLLRR